MYMDGKTKEGTDQDFQEDRGGYRPDAGCMTKPRVRLVQGHMPLDFAVGP